VTGQIGLHSPIAQGSAVAFAVGQVFQDRRHRGVLGVHRQPEPGRQPAAVLQWDGQVFDLPDPAGKLPDLVHGPPHREKRSTK
jgi:hypothetical protein